jgi:hypothetical protein
MSESDEIDSLRQEIADLRRQLAEALADRSVLIFENESLDRQRRADAVRLAQRGLDS